MTAPGKQFDVAVVGELNLDIILAGLPETLELDREHLASNLKVTLGSSSAIFAHNLATLGNKVSFSGAIGEDEFGEICLKRLAEAGVDSSRVRKVRGRQTGLTVVLPNKSTKRHILTYLGTMSELRFEDLDLEHICRAKHFHLSSFFLQSALRPRIVDLFRHVKNAGLTTSLDTNDDPADEWAEDLLPVLKYVDVLLPNEREACKISRKTDAASAADFLARLVPLVVIKRGAQGALAQQGDNVVTVVGRSGDAVDTVGAGDSFDAGFLHQYIRGAKVEKCLAFGNLTGALNVTRAGGTEAFRDAKHRDEFLKANWAGENFVARS